MWLPDEWEVVGGQMFELLALGPPDQDPYRANLSIVHITANADQPSLEQIVEATARIQQQSLQTFVEYDRRPVIVAGLHGIHREYGWIQEGTGLVLYQLEELAVDELAAEDQSARPRLLEVHATSSAPAYFRFAALLRRMLESIERQPAACGPHSWS
jgi:hypothetical protein